MPTLDPLHPLQSAILELLIVSPGLTMAALHERVCKESKVDVSLQNLYRTVSQMIEAQQLIREKGKLSINMVWASHLARFADQVRQHYLNSTPSILDLPTEDGKKREFFAESLGALDPLWNHILRTIAGMYDDPEWYEYNSHPWHFLGATETERRLYESLGPRGHKIYGNDAFLDRYGVKLNTDGSDALIATDTVYPKEGYSLWLCGDYIVDCIFPEVLSQHFAFFFQTVHTIEQFHPELFADIFRMRARCRLLVWKSAKEAALLRKKFLTLFATRQKKTH